MSTVANDSTDIGIYSDMEEEVAEQRNAADFLANNRIIENNRTDLIRLDNTFTSKRHSNMSSSSSEKEEEDEDEVDVEEADSVSRQEILL